MQPAHAGLAITHQAFDKVLEHLLAVMDGAGVAPAVSARIPRHPPAVAARRGAGADGGGGVIPSDRSAGWGAPALPDEVQYGPQIGRPGGTGG